MYYVNFPANPAKNKTRHLWSEVSRPFSKSKVRWPGTTGKVLQYLSRENGKISWNMIMS